MDHLKMLYAQCTRERVVHPNGPLQTTPWNREFAILAPDKNLVTFFEPLSGG
jgi:hypothetical protein